MNRVNTHLGIDAALCGAPEELAEGTARVRMRTLPEMSADARGLVHGGFVFGLADYAAMLAVNDPNVVLGAAEVRFEGPCVVDDELVAEAEVLSEKGRKRQVEVRVTRGGESLFTGTFSCFVLDAHVLDT
jgi:acyl-coenzyme A thioesterase PaaI-like protein